MPLKASPRASQGCFAFRRSLTPGAARGRCWLPGCAHSGPASRAVIGLTELAKISRHAQRAIVFVNPFHDCASRLIRSRLACWEKRLSSKTAIYRDRGCSILSTKGELKSCPLSPQDSHNQGTYSWRWNSHSNYSSLICWVTSCSPSGCRKLVGLAESWASSTRPSWKEPLPSVNPMQPGF